MAEGLATVASGIAVLTIAVQLAESVKKLCDFWNSIKEAPEDIQAISLDLELLSSVLTRIANETQHVEPDATLVASLNSCCAKVRILTTLLNDIEPGFASSSLRIRKWTAFKAVLKHGQLMKFQAALERLKGTLLLVQQNQYSFRAEEWDAATFSAGSLQPAQNDHSVSSRSWQQHAWVKRTLRVERSVMEYFLGTIRAESKTQLRTARETDGLMPYCEQDQYENETSYTIYPAAWLIRLGVQYGLNFRFLSSSTQGWKTTLKAFCPVPDDALIFEFCKEGNVPAVRRYTPLHFAAQNYHSELCKILTGAGADINALTHNAPTRGIFRTPMALAAWESNYTTNAMLPEAFDTLRLLIDSMDFLDEMGSGWEIFVHLCDSAHVTHGDPDAKMSLLLWMLRLSGFELKTYLIRQEFLRMLSRTLDSSPKLEEASKFLLNLGGADIINAAIYGTNGYTILHFNVVFATEGRVNVTLARGSDLYRLGFEDDYTPQYESPTSLAMYSSWAFMVWLHGLVAIEVDIEEYINQELGTNFLVHPGWEKETLHDLFLYNYRPEVDFREPFGTRCSDCSQIIYRVRVQPHWRHLLERIKQKIDPDSPAQADSELSVTKNADVRSIAEATSSSDDLAHGSDTTETLPLDDLNELSSELESEEEPELASKPESEKESEEEDVHRYPETISIRSECIYDWDEVVCVDCWLHYRQTGHRFAPHSDDDRSLDEYIASGDESSEDEYSPYLIHT
ncbi:MAG: hypothetical protein ASARMPREDX12_006859 [Alectoria sarmentosa]|nr:MAG: hypothetical protein ASARMPREDX12_006859 [Alectoria sarmentosa]